MPFGGTLDLDNRWVIFSSLMPWEELEETYAPQFNLTTGAPAKPARLVFGALFIKQKLGLTDEAPAGSWRWPPPAPETAPFQSKHVFPTSLRTSTEALLHLVRDRWSIVGWYWIRDTQLHEDAHRYRGNGAGVMETLRTAAMNLLRLSGFRSIRSGMKAVMHDITGLLAVARRRPQPSLC